MKKITKIIVVVAVFFASLTTYAQAVHMVPPGIGTLNTAISTYGGTRIYQLQAGQFYQLSAMIENVGYHLQIIGEAPVGGGKPATLQTNDFGGVPFPKMFDAKGDVTIKNVYIVNADFNGSIPDRLMDINAANAKVTIDNCVIDPVSLSLAFEANQPDVSINFTNNLAMNHGHELSPNDGHFFVSHAAMNNLLVENNTFVAMGTNMHMGDFNTKTDGVVKWNHNTWVMQKSQIDWSTWETSYIFTNNLMYDFQTQPWSQAWQPMPGGDPAFPKHGLIMAAPLPGETFPSARQQYIEYNGHARNPGFYTLLANLNQVQTADGNALLTYMPLIWGSEYNETNPNVNLRSRETIAFANKTDFPKWNYGNEYNDVDPQFEDPKIYQHSNNFVSWTDPATRVHAMGKDPSSVPPVTSWAKWHWDEDGDPGNNVAWPVFNGKYTNPQMLTGSIESLPLGDLNWFPAEKAIWLANKTRIEAHIAANNTGKIAMISDVCGLKPTATFTTQYEQNFTGGSATWDGTTFYNQWDTQDANIFTAADLANGYLQYVWPPKRVLQSKAEYNTPYRIETQMMLAGGSNRGGLVLRVGPIGNIEEVQEPATGDPGFNRKGIAIYPSSDGSAMVVQFTGAFGSNPMPVTRINVPLPAGVANVLSPATQFNLKVEDHGSSLYVFINNNCFFNINLSGLVAGIYTSGEIIAADGSSLGIFTDRYVPEKGKIAIAQRDANLQLYNVKIETGGTLGVNDNSMKLSDLKVYPNPVKDRINLAATKEIKDLIIYNLLGQEVMRKAVNSTNSSVDISNLKTGTYILKVAIDDAEETFKILKE